LITAVHAPRSLEGAEGGNGSSVTEIGSGAGGFGERFCCAEKPGTTITATQTLRTSDSKALFSSVLIRKANEKPSILFLSLNQNRLALNAIILALSATVKQWLHQSAA
jgi:hypothetical protein